MSDAPKKAELDTDAPDPHLVRSRTLAAARDAQVQRNQFLESFGVTAMEVKLWSEQRGPKAYGIDIAGAR